MRNRPRRSPGCARSTTRRRSSPTALSSTRMEPQRDLAHHALRRCLGRHREARGAGRRAARDRAHQGHGALLPPGQEPGEGRPAHRARLSALLPERITALARHYEIELGKVRASRATTARRSCSSEGQLALRLPALRRHRERHAAQGGDRRPRRRSGRAVLVHAAHNRRGDARHGEGAALRPMAHRRRRGRAARRDRGDSRPSCPASRR